MTVRTIIALLTLVLAVAAYAQQPAPTVALERSHWRSSWRLVPELRFGQDQDLTHVLTVLPLGDGSVVVADDKNHHIYVFSPNGRYSHQLGRLGRGPGEFMRIRRAGLLRDSIWVIDGVEPRTSFFSQDGGLLTSVRNDAGAYLIGVIPGAAISLQGMVPGTPTAGRDEHVPVVLTRRSGEVLDTVAWLPSRHRMLVLPRPDGSYTIGQQSITDAGFAVVGTGQPALYVVDRSVAESAADASFAVVSLSPRGDTLWARSFRYAPQPYDKGDSVWAAKAPGLRRRGHSDSEIRAAVFIPEFYPPVSDAVAATDGSLWLRREENTDVVQYWVIDPSGELLGTAVAPLTVRIAGASATHAWGVELDQYDVPTIIRYRIDR